MFDRIRNNVDLSPYIVNHCCENGICVNFEESVGDNERLIIKVDDYYNSQNLGKMTPPSPDCMIIVKCKKGGYNLHLVELKNITSCSGFRIENMTGKFETCLNDFISVRFRELLFIDYKNVKLYFVSKIDFIKHDMGLKYEVLINTRLKFNGKNHMIRTYLPNPAIKACY